MKRMLWVERKFTFDLPPGWLPNVLERLRGTHARLIRLCAPLTEEEAEFKPDGKWSIKEHIGHLSDLEALHEGRIDDFIAGKVVLRAADMRNRKTEESNHNAYSRAELIANFAAIRAHFISRLEELDDETQAFESLHPRLNVRMKPVDMAYFTAEHDDHHLATMREIFYSFKM